MVPPTCVVSNRIEIASIQLVERFYDPLIGKIYVSYCLGAYMLSFPYIRGQIDGQDISQMNVQEYRKHIALVSQEPVRVIY